MNDEPKKTGRPALPADQKLKPVPVRLTDAQKAKLARIGHQRLRDWLDRVKESDAQRMNSAAPIGVGWNDLLGGFLQET